MWDSRIGASPTATMANGRATSKGRSFLGRVRKLSTSLPQFRPGPDAYSKEKSGRPEGFRVSSAVRRILGRMGRKRFLFVLFLALLVVLWYTSRTSTPLRSPGHHHASPRTHLC